MDHADRIAQRAEIHRQARAQAAVDEAAVTRENQHGDREQQRPQHGPARFTASRQEEDDGEDHIGPGLGAIDADRLFQVSAPNDEKPRSSSMLLTCPETLCAVSNGSWLVFSCPGSVSSFSLANWRGNETGTRNPRKYLASNQAPENFVL
jgi:hypothetical protein